MYSFSPNTQAKSAQVNQNFTDLSTGAADTIANSLQTSRQLTAGNFVASGLTIPTSASLSATIAGGIAFVNGKYLSTSATAKLFTASKDTYVDLKDDGTFAYVEAVNGATTGMTLTSNLDTTPALRIAKVVTSATAVTGVQQYGTEWLMNPVYPRSPHVTLQEKWITPTLSSGWGAWDNGALFSTGSSQYGYPQYMKDSSGFVHMRGLAKNTSGGNNTNSVNAVIFNLPVGYRPSWQSFWPVVGNDVFMRLDVLPNGNVQFISGSVSVLASNGFIGINPITFRADF